MSEQNNGGNMDFGKSLGKILRAGVGAVATVVEQGKGFVDDLTTEGTQTNQKATEFMQNLAQKGEETLGQTKAFSEQLKNKVKDAICDGALDFDNIMSVLDRFGKDELTAIRDKANELLSNSDAPKAEEPQAEEPQSVADKFAHDFSEDMKDKE